ncbi:MAG TPA: BTAD domain-containing putative transcriptional regulator [Solirubrobacteraceae bacterium]|nr:BTAD domain-containing putative transcriptional regulator [Solirubrobacteraceae bacterium]
MGKALDFGVLGPLLVSRPEGPIELTADKQRALLAVLLLAYREESVSPARLVDELWGDDPPATAAKAVQVHLSKLRGALGPEQPIVTRPSGYAVDIEPEQLDLARFEALGERARTARRHGDLPAAAGLWREALSLFRGPPLADVPLRGLAAAEAGRLAELELTGLDERISVELELGEHGSLVAELQALVAEYPYRERLHAQLMLALYRSGRQAEALEAFRHARRTLVDDLGLEPGRELQQLESAVLAHDPALDLLLAEPPRPRPVAVPPLPAPTDPLIGRESVLDAAASMLAVPDVRMITLTGPGGIGKTRLALELARREAGRFADGPRFVPLGAIDDPERVLPEIARVLEIAEDDGKALTGFVAERELLLVADNLEQIVDAAPLLGELLAVSPRSKLVTTSRAPLRLAGEHELPVPPLASEPARELFVTRARAINPGLELSPEDVECVERICARLDGLPLAIELAAARSKVLSPKAILDRLEQRLDLLIAGPRDAPARQRTLRAAIGWSYDLLGDEARSLFADLGVFVGGWTLETAEAVGGADALDGIAALADQSLVTRNGDRYEMYESIRAYALEQLTATGGADDARRRHARAFAALTEEAENGIRGPAQATWFARLDADAENLRAATAWAVVDGDTDTALGLAGGLLRFWAARGALTERRETLAMALAAGAGSPAPRINALQAAGVMAAESGDFDAAGVHFDAALQLARAVGDRARIARLQSNLGTLDMYAGDYEQALRRYEEGAAILREMGDPLGLSLVTQNLAIAQDGAGRRDRAIALLEESVQLARRAGDPAHTASALRTLARVLLAGEDDRERAMELIRESLTRSRDLGDRPGMIECLETVAGEADARTGALLLGAAGAARAAAGVIRQPDETAWVEATTASLRAALGDDFGTALADGAALPLEDAVEQALAVG